MSTDTASTAADLIFNTAFVASYRSHWLIPHLPLLYAACLLVVMQPVQPWSWRQLQAPWMRAFREDR